MWHIQQEWCDGKRRSLEQQLNHFVRGLYKIVDQRKARDLRFKREELERQERYRQHAEQQKAQELAMEKIKKLELEAVNWQKSRLIRAYLEAKRENYLKKDGPIVPGSEFESWLLWASNYADKLDPLGVH